MARAVLILRTHVCGEDPIDQALWGGANSHDVDVREHNYGLNSEYRSRSSKLAVMVVYVHPESMRLETEELLDLQIEVGSLQHQG